MDECLRELEAPDSVEIRVVDEMPVIRGNRIAMQQVFSNLISNAAKFMDKDPGLVEILCRSENSHWEFCVKDNGPGIEHRHLSRLTERFYRIDSGRDSRSGGTGLGLAIVKHALASPGGKRHIASKVGGGSTFSCLLPAEALCTETDMDTGTAAPEGK